MLGHRSPQFIKTPLFFGDYFALSEVDGIEREKHLRGVDAKLFDIRKQSREWVFSRFSSELVAEQYRTVYNQLFSRLIGLFI